MLPILLPFRQYVADNGNMYPRLLNLHTVLQKKSHFLFGPRATGKSWLIHEQLKSAQIFNLLESSTFDRFLRRPQSFAEEVNSPMVVIDEIQKLPRLLDEVHRLIEEKKIHFLLTGSSARKLKHGGANLLAGRARSLSLFPLISREITDFELEKYCNVGGLPMIYRSSEPWLDLKDYVHLYLKEEIIAEAIVRKVDHYARFLDVVGQCSGEELNYQQISNESEVPVRTVDNFIEVLKDTLLAFELEPFRKTKNRKAVTKSKIYLFDVGVANYLAGRREVLPGSEAFGKVFEHFMIQEIRACLSYRQIDEPMTYWRTGKGNFEVDCIIGKQLAVEIKSSERFQEKMLAGLRALKEEQQIKNYILVTRDPIERTVDGISVMHYSKFLDLLWSHDKTLTPSPALKTLFR